MLTFDPQTLQPNVVYNLITTTITPRPVAWVSTLSAEGIRNLAAFSYFNAMSSLPPMVVFSVGVYRDGRVKDTLNNLRAVSECVIHIGDESLIPQIELSGLEFPSEIDEFNETRLTALPSEVVRPPRIAEAKIALECAVREIHPMPAPSRNTLVICEVLRFHIHPDVLPNPAEGYVDVLKVNPVARAGKKEFVLLNRLVDGLPLMEAFRHETKQEQP
ncbi:MAG TPA: flavin reductase family protein [Aggregatilineales bacterium]|nr:flavin reductase family protein [Anaerolineales bacterium]HRE48536.1 flavin reductase family protein [Aggregatilineales bacterium]